MGFDFVHEKLDADSVEIPFNRMRRTCPRCSQIFWTEEMVPVGEEKWYCKLCFDPVYGEGAHIRGDGV